MSNTREKKRQNERSQGNWYKKIIGFRSGTKWKMVVACFVYLAIIGEIIDGFKSNKKEAQQVTADIENERQKAIKKAQDEDKANAEEEKKKQEKEVAAQPVEKKEESLEDKVKKLTSNEFGKEKVESVKVNDNLGTEDPNDKIVLITAEAKENVSANYTKKGM
ncbi:hypothetical protein ACTFQO_25090 [Bacillus cereus group sp. MYBK29-1]|uniref:hypothetical protein n=1 Tax=Bacillus cereus group sp. MYBK29-1 TaxID=3450637 RepID=UPI003F79AAFB